MENGYGARQTLDSISLSSAGYLPRLITRGTMVQVIERLIPYERGLINAAAC